VEGWTHGYAPDGEYGTSCVNNLLFVQALKHAAEVEDIAGDAELARRWRSIADKTAAAIVEHFWVEAQGRLADDLQHTHFSEHAQCLALLNDVLSADQQPAALKSLLNDADLLRTTVYFSHYLFETLYRFREAPAMMQRLDFWKKLIDQGFKTPVEQPEPSRSDCHAWGSHPLYHFHASLAGVRPAEAGFARVIVEPMPGELKHIESTLPHPRGRIVTVLDFDEAGGCEANIELPPEISGQFVWAGKRYPLAAGANHHVCVGI
jgi:hypothetical protein